tara:strand:+ start:113 stop:673 length:561 start_codon:yes stop_codon:yes gene_type:complete
MNKKDVINKIKAIFTSQVESVEDEVIEFVDVKLEDGRILRTADMVIGSTVVEVTEDGEIAVEDGDYTLEDGVVVKVEDGMIQDIVAVEEETEEEEVIEETEEELSIEEETELNAMLDVLKELMGEFKSVKEEFKSVKEELETVKDLNSELNERVEKFATAPSAEGTKTEINFSANTKEKSVLHGMI